MRIQIRSIRCKRWLCLLGCSELRAAPPLPLVSLGGGTWVTWAGGLPNLYLAGHIHSLVSILSRSLLSGTCGTTVTGTLWGWLSSGLQGALTGGRDRKGPARLWLFEEHLGAYPGGRVLRAFPSGSLRKCPQRSVATATECPEPLGSSSSPA